MAKKIKVISKKVKGTPKKLRAIWNPDICQDIDAVTSPNSPFYDKDITERIIKEHGTIEKYKKYMKSKNL